MDRPSSTSEIGTPVWEIAEFFPLQGEWSEEQYLRLETPRLVELSDGKLEVLPMPSEWHQIIALFLYRSLQSYAELNRRGLTLAAPLRVRLWSGKMREPDVVFMLAENRKRRGNSFWERADLVMEVVSEDDPQRDLILKREEYAKAGIPEYWIVDPRDTSIRVLRLIASENASIYDEAGCYTLGQTAKSILLPGFALSPTEVFDTSREF